MKYTKILYGQGQKAEELKASMPESLLTKLGGDPRGSYNFWREFGMPKAWSWPELNVAVDTYVHWAQGQWRDPDGNYHDIPNWTPPTTVLLDYEAGQGMWEDPNRLAFMQHFWYRTAAILNVPRIWYHCPAFHNVADEGQQVEPTSTPYAGVAGASSVPLWVSTRQQVVERCSRLPYAVGDPPKPLPFIGYVSPFHAGGAELLPNHEELFAAQLTGVEMFSGCRGVGTDTVLRIEWPFRVAVGDISLNPNEIDEYWERTEWAYDLLVKP